MEFRETLLAAQRNQQQKSSEPSSYYKAKFDPPKKEQKPKDKLSANIQKFLAKKEEEEKQKKLEALKKRDELLAMRDPKAMRKIQKTLKVIKSANKSVLEDAIDRDNTAITREGASMGDQDDYGYESQEAAALYSKMMQKYSKIPDEPKFPVGSSSVKKDLNSIREKVKHALQHEDDPVPHKRKRKKDNADRDLSPPPVLESEKKKEEKKDKPKIRKPLPPPMDFNQLLKLAEQKKSEPVDIVQKKAVLEPEPERLMTKKQKREYEEEMARRQRRMQILEAEKSGKKVIKEEKPMERERKPESSGGLGRIPKIGEKANAIKNDIKSLDREKLEKERIDKLRREKEKAKMERERSEKEKDQVGRDRLEKLKAERERIDRELEKLSKEEQLKAERERIDRELEKLSKDKARSKSDSGLDKKSYKIDDRSKSKEQIKQNIDLKSQNTYRIEDRRKNGDVKSGSSIVKDRLQVKQKSVVGSDSPKTNGFSKEWRDNGKKLPEKGLPPKRPEDRKMLPSIAKASSSSSSSQKPLSNSFDFDKHVNSLKNDRKPIIKDGKKRPDARPAGSKRPSHRIDSESEYDSEMDDFIDDGEEDMDYSRHIKEIFGYDKSKYRDMDDDDDPTMESSFARQQREEYISKKIGIMEDLEDMRMEAMEKQKMSKKKRRISDDD